MVALPEQLEYDVRIKKSTIFHPRAALACMRHLHVEGMRSGLSGPDRLHLLGSMINMACTHQLCALGALLSILHQEGLVTGKHPASISAISAGATKSVCMLSPRLP